MIRTLGVRAFLRGGYLDRKHPALVMKHATPLGLWIPFDEDGSPALDARIADLLEPVHGKPEPWWYQPSIKEK